MAKSANRKEVHTFLIGLGYLQLTVVDFNFVKIICSQVGRRHSSGGDKPRLLDLTHKEEAIVNI